jgi:hypothetical protein
VQRLTATRRRGLALALTRSRRNWHPNNTSYVTPFGPLQVAGVFINGVGPRLMRVPREVPALRNPGKGWQYVAAWPVGNLVLPPPQPELG